MQLESIQFKKGDCVTLNRFYKRHKDKARAKSSDSIYIAQQGDTVYAGLRLLGYGNFYFLRGVLTAPNARGQGVASQLINHAIRECSAPIYTLPLPTAVGLYQRLGFRPIDGPDIPIELSASYRRFRQTTNGPTVMVINI